MKKAININFILAAILSLALLLVPLGMGIIVKGIENDVQEIEEKLERLEDDFEEESVYEYELTKEYSQGMGSYARMIFLVVLFLVGGYAILIFLTAFLAWMIYRKNHQKLISYRVLMSINYLLQLGVLLVMADMLLEQFQFMVLLLAIIESIALCYSASRTYTKRIIWMKE